MSSFVTDELRRRILEGGLQPGERLRPDALADDLEVSKIPVREALRQLEAEGLVTIYPRRGATVSRLSLEQMRDITDIRVLLEQRAIRSAIPHMTAEDFRAIDALLAEMASERDDLSAWLDTNRRFHAALYRPSGRDVLLQLIDGLRAQGDRYLRLNAPVSNLIDVSNAEHEAIVEACRAGDPGRAETLIAAHIHRNTEELSALLGEDGAAAADGKA